MQIVLTILFLLVGSCFGGWTFRENPADPNLAMWRYTADEIRPIETPKRQFIVCDDGVLNDLEKCGIYLFVWGDDNCVLVTRQNGDAKRITATKWQWQGTARVMSYPEALAEIIDGWKQDDRQYDHNDLAGLSRHWHGHEVVKPEEPNEPTIPEVVIDPAAMAILEKYMDKADAKTIGDILAALANGDNLMGLVTVYKYTPDWYHRPVCMHLPKGRNAVGALSTMSLIEAILQDRKPCSQCKPPTMGDK